MRILEDSEKTLLAEEFVSKFTQIKRIGFSGSLEGIRPSEYILLNILTRNIESGATGMKISDLSNHLQITPAAVTHAINSLEESGYVERFSDSSDRRVVLVRVSEKSREVVKAIQQKQFELLKGLINYMGIEDSKEFIRLITKTIHYMKTWKQEQP